MKPIFAAVLALPLLAGCGRAAPVEYSSSEQVRKLKPELQAQIRKMLDKDCGTFARPKLLGDSQQTTSHLIRGRDVYMQRCTHCHGDSGDGQGQAAQWLNPRPRDYRRGKFKFASTPYDNKPLHADLVRTVRSGIPGTSMPSFNLVSADEIDAVVDYVLVLTHRGELEFQLANEAESSDELSDEMLAELTGVVLDQWRDSEANVMHPLTPEPKFDVERVMAGKQQFLTRGCSKCHGEDGRGQTPDNLRGDLKDVWGHATRAADLTSGLLHGGRRPEDVYRRIFGGITGTPMPSFKSALANDPEALWNLAGYVLYVSNRRRAGEIPETGLLALPTPPAASQPAAE